jgi:hypothetical protein
MARLFAWIERLRWLLLFAVAIGAVLIYFGWTQGTHIRDVEANGVEGIATIEGATRTKSRRGGEHYTLRLAWRDARGRVRTDGGVRISNAFASQIIVNDKIVRDSVRIKYLPVGSEDSTPVILEDEARQLEDNDLMTWLGAGIGGVGAVGSALIVLLGRRRRSEAAGAG